MYQHLGLQSSQFQIPRMQHKKHNTQDNVFPLEPRSRITADDEYSNITEAHIKDLKVALMNIVEIVKNEMMKSL